MKKSIRNLSYFLIILVVIFVSVLLWQRENISALINGLTKSSDDIAFEIDKRRDELKLQIEKYTTPVNDLTAEDEQKLLKGEMSLEDVAEKYNLPIHYMRDDVNEGDYSKPESDESPDSTLLVDNSKKIEKEIGDGVSRMYALKVKYVNKLGELEREVIDQYSKLPKEKQNTQGKKELVTANIDYVASLEKTCDTEVNNLISALEKTLKDLGGDVEIINILKNAYADEKELKKSYYLSLYNE